MAESCFTHPGLGGLRAESSLAMVIWESRLSHRSRSSSLLINSNIRFTSLSPEIMTMDRQCTLDTSTN